MNKLPLQQIANLAMETGKIVLQSGAETSQVEAVMQNVCTGFGYQEAESYVTLTGIFLTVKDGDNESVTNLKRIDNRTVDLDKISSINRLMIDLSQTNCLNNDCAHMTVAEFKQRLDIINNRKAYPMWIKFLCGGITTGFFALLFGGSWTEFTIAFCIGLMVRTIIYGIAKLNINAFLINAFAAAMIVLFAKYFSMQLGGIRTDKIIIGGIMLLVPGLAITNAVRDTMSGNFVSGTARTAEALYISAAIATGAGSMLKLWSLIG